MLIFKAVGLQIRLSGVFPRVPPPLQGKGSGAGWSPEQVCMSREPTWCTPPPTPATPHRRFAPQLLSPRNCLAGAGGLRVCLNEMCVKSSSLEGRGRGFYNPATFSFRIINAYIQSSRIANPTERVCLNEMCVKSSLFDGRGASAQTLGDKRTFHLF